MLLIDGDINLMKSFFLTFKLIYLPVYVTINNTYHFSVDIENIHRDFKILFVTDIYYHGR